MGLSMWDIANTKLFIFMIGTNQGSPNASNQELALFTMVRSFVFLVSTVSVVVACAMISPN